MHRLERYAEPVTQVGERDRAVFAETIPPAAGRVVAEVHTGPVAVVTVRTAGGDEAVRFPVPAQLLGHRVRHDVDQGLACRGVFCDGRLTPRIGPAVDRRPALGLANVAGEGSERVAPLDKGTPTCSRENTIGGGNRLVSLLEKKL